MCFVVFLKLFSSCPSRCSRRFKCNAINNRTFNLYEHTSSFIDTLYMYNCKNDQNSSQKYHFFQSRFSFTFWLKHKEIRQSIRNQNVGRRPAKFHLHIIWANAKIIRHGRSQSNNTKCHAKRRNNQIGLMTRTQ